MFERPLVFIDHAGNFDKSLIPRMKACGFGSVAIRGQMGVWTDEPDPERKADPQRRRLHPGEITSLRDALRGQGFKVALWVGLDLGNDWPGFSLDEAARVSTEHAKHFDGLLVNAEAIYEHTGPYLAWLGYFGPLALSTLPTFSMGEIGRMWDNRLAWLMQQAYMLENGHNPVSCRNWALGGSYAGVEYPPLKVGWWYRATVLGRSRRVYVTGEDWMGYKVKEFANTWGLDRDTRLIFNRRTAKIVGELHGLWAPHRWAPTLRTTPYNGQTLTAAELRDQVRYAGDPPAGIYLGESTPEEFWQNYRP